MIARRRLCIQRVRGGELRRQSRQLVAGAFDIVGQRRLGDGGALLGFGEAVRACVRLCEKGFEMVGWHGDKLGGTKLE